MVMVSVGPNFAAQFVPFLVRHFLRPFSSQMASRLFCRSAQSETRPGEEIRAGHSDRRADEFGNCADSELEAVREVPSAICRGRAALVQKCCRCRLVTARQKLAIPGHEAQGLTPYGRFESL